MPGPSSGLPPTFGRGCSLPSHKVEEACKRLAKVFEGKMEEREKGRRRSSRRKRRRRKKKGKNKGKGGTERC